MSVRYSIAKAALKLVGYKKIFQQPEQKLLDKINGYNRNRDFKIPTDRKAVYGDVPVCGGKYHCLTIQQGKQRTKNAILFFFGGGMMIGPDKMAIGIAAAFGKDCDADVWFPYYPLCTEHCITETYEMIFDTYRKMVEVYGADHIVNLGFSSGGALAIGVCLYNNELGQPVPMPRAIVSSSPGCCPDSPEMLEKMRALNDKDLMVDVKFMSTVRTFMEHGRQDVPEFMLSGTRGSFKGLPILHLWYGSDEVLYACADEYVNACRRDNTPYTLTVGKGMAHCYPMIKFIPEGKAANREICGQIRKAFEK